MPIISSDDIFKHIAERQKYSDSNKDKDSDRDKEWIGDEPEISEDDLEEVLESKGIAPKLFPSYTLNSTTNPKALTGLENNDSEKLKRVLNHNGASVENAARCIASVMSQSKYESSKLRASELVLDLHGMRDRDGHVHKQPIFQFFIKDSSVNLNDIFCPVRPSLDEMEQSEQNMIEGSIKNE